LGLATLLFLLIAGIIALPFITTIISNLTKTAEQKAADAAKQKRREDEGLLQQINRLIAGDTIVDNAKKNAENAKSRRIELQFKTDARKLKQEQARKAGFASIDEFEKATDTNRTREDNITKFNPKGIVGFGIKSINGGKGIKDTPENRLIVLQKSQIKDSVMSRRKRQGRQRR